jgi:hypothetical protein
MAVGCFVKVIIPTIIKIGINVKRRSIPIRHGRAGAKRRDPAIPLRLAGCAPKRDRRDKPGDDVKGKPRDLRSCPGMTGR